MDELKRSGMLRDQFGRLPRLNVWPRALRAAPGTLWRLRSSGAVPLYNQLDELLALLLLQGRVPA
jgi:hypothetical protein